MKRSVLLLSVVLLAFSASAWADGIGISYVSVSMSSVQSSGYDGCVLPPLCPRLGLILPPICAPCPAITLCPMPSPYMALCPAVTLLGGPYIQPSPAVVVIGLQSPLITPHHDAAMAIIMNMRQ